MKPETISRIKNKCKFCEYRGYVETAEDLCYADKKSGTLPRVSKDGICIWAKSRWRIQSRGLGTIADIERYLEQEEETLVDPYPSPGAVEEARRKHVREEHQMETIASRIENITEVLNTHGDGILAILKEIELLRKGRPNIKKVHPAEKGLREGS